MARIVMIGGGIVGLCGAMMLARDGHDVIVLERDAAAPPGPEHAWDEWERRGVNQFRMLHYFQPRFRALMETELPEVIPAFEAAGALRFNPIRALPAEVTGGERPDDRRFDVVTARRPVAEAVVAGCAAATEHLDVRRGVAVAGLIAEPSPAGIPNVVGVRTETGEEIRGEIVVDASGRRSTLPSLLADIGARAPVEEAEDTGFVYYGRHFRSGDGSTPPIMAPLLAPYGTVSVLTLPADNGTWGVGIVASSRDKEMRKVKDVDAWTRVAKSFPLSAHWIDGEPLGDDVAIMAKIPDRHRTFVVDDEPVATGVLALADSWACTNPSVGRGMAIGALHAVALRDLLHDAPPDPVDLARQWHEATLDSVEPWYRETLAFDQGRIGEIDALLEGRTYEGDPTFEITQALQAALLKDPDVLRAFFEIVTVQTLPAEVLARPGLFEKVVELGSNWRDEPLPGPTRDDLLAALAG